MDADESAHSYTKPNHMSNNGIPAHLSIPGNSTNDYKRALERSNSMPNGIDSPVQLRHSSSRSRKKAQHLRNSVAVTSSDYYNQRRPQISQLAVVQQTHSPRRSVTSPLHPITEHDSDDYYSRGDQRSSLIIDLHDLNGLQMTDSRLFRYRSTGSLGPSTSRPTTPQVSNPQISKLKRNSSMTSSTSSISRAGSVSSLCDGTYTPPPGTPPRSRRPFSVLKMSSQAIPLSSSTENQFLPLYINPESGFVYMFEEGYYIPLSPENVQSLQNTTRVSITQPPIPDRRSKVSVTSQPPSQQQNKIMDAPSAYVYFVQILMLFFAICLDLPVLLLCAVPALLCSLQVRKANRKGQFDTAKRLSEYVMCFSILGVIFHVIFILSVMAMFLLLHFLGGYFT